MECKCGAETVQRVIQSTIKGDLQKAEYQQCPKCFRQHVYPSEQVQYDKVVAMQSEKAAPR